MIFLQILTALPLALLIGTLFSTRFATRTPIIRLPSFFLAVFLASWAGGFWVIPVGDVVWVVYWVPFVVAGTLAAGLLTAISLMPSMRESTEEAIKDSTARTQALTATEGMLWIVSALLVIRIVWHYVT